MIIKTKEFKEVANTILLAVDSSNEFSTNLELEVRSNFLYLSVTNKEYFVAVKFPVEDNSAFKAVVEAPLFLSLVSGITTELFTLEDNGNTITIKVGKSSYKLPKIYENDELLKLPIICLSNDPTVEMNISNDILKSILNVNSKEIVKSKNLDVSELQKLYYITDEGCFTFTTGACLNSFKLEKPIKMLLNDRVVKLFKLFKDDVKFAFGTDVVGNRAQTKITLRTDDIYLGVIITNDDKLLGTVSRPCDKTKNIIYNEKYDNKLVLSVSNLSAAISRLMLFTKNSADKANMSSIPATFTIKNGELTIRDNYENEECITFANDNSSYTDAEYSMILNLADLKLVLDSCKEDYITLNCGNHQSVVVARTNIYNLLPEGVRA